MTTEPTTHTPPALLAHDLLTTPSTGSPLARVFAYAAERKTPDHAFTFSEFDQTPIQPHTESESIAPPGTAVALRTFTFFT